MSPPAQARGWGASSIRSRCIQSAFGFGDLRRRQRVRVIKFAFAGGWAAAPWFRCASLLWAIQGVGRRHDRGGWSGSSLQLHHRAGGFVRCPNRRSRPGSHQDREIADREAVDASWSASLDVYVHRALPRVPRPKLLGGRGRPVTSSFDQVYWVAVGVLVLIHGTVAKRGRASKVTVTCSLLCSSFDGQQQQIVEVEGVVGGQGAAGRALVGLALLRPRNPFGFASITSGSQPWFLAC